MILPSTQTQVPDLPTALPMFGSPQWRNEYAGAFVNPRSLIGSSNLALVDISTEFSSVYVASTAFGYSTRRVGRLREHGQIRRYSGVAMDRSRSARLDITRVISISTISFISPITYRWWHQETYNDFHGFRAFAPPVRVVSNSTGFHGFWLYGFRWLYWIREPSKAIRRFPDAIPLVPP